LNNFTPAQESLPGVWEEGAQHPGRLAGGDQGLHGVPVPGGGGGPVEGNGVGLCSHHLAAAFIWN